MLKKILAFVAMLYVAVSFAAVDVNQGSAADLDSVKGIGPAISTRILTERKKSNFKDWNDFISRVNGIGEKSAAKLSTAGLTVNGTSYQGAAPAAAPKKDAKPATAKAAETKPAPAAAAAPAAKEEKQDPKADAKAKKDAEKKAKAEEKAKKAEEAKAKKEAAKQAKEDAKKAKAAKADAPKAAASAAKK